MYHMSNQERKIQLQDGRSFTAAELEESGLIDWEIARVLFAEGWGRPFRSTREQVLEDPFPLIRALLLLFDDEALAESNFAVLTQLGRTY